VEQVESLPGVRSATLSENRLLRGAVWQRSVFLEGQDAESEGGGRRYHRNNVVVPGFFKTAGIPIVSGRDFEERDRADTKPVVIINETMAKLAWPGEDPIGRRFHFDDPSEPLVEVIGVARDAKYREVHETPQFFIYQPLTQRYTPAMTLHVRTEGNPAALIGTLRREVQSLDPNLPLADVDTMSAFVSRALWMERMSAYLLTAFGLLALTLAVVGVCGVVAYSVAQRQREIGIRMAVGARRRDIVRGVLGDAARVVAVGLVVGLVLAFFGLKPLLANQLYGVEATDPLTYAGQALLLGLAALLASLIPSLLSARVNPVETLRVE
jgi:putative ABC transport system permease protein